jgi:hypothetical protein
VLNFVDVVVPVYLVVVLVVGVVLELDFVIVLVDLEVVVIIKVLLLFGPTATDGNAGIVPAGSKTFLFCVLVVAAVGVVIFMLDEALVVEELVPIFIEVEVVVV